MRTESQHAFGRKRPGADFWRFRAMPKKHEFLIPRQWLKKSEKSVPGDLGGDFSTATDRRGCHFQGSRPQGGHARDKILGTRYKVQRYKGTKASWPVGKRESWLV